MSKLRVTSFSLRLTHALPFSLAAALLVAACADKREQTQTASTPTPSQSSNAQTTQPTQTASPGATTATSTPTPAPPQTAEVGDKIARIFEGTVQPDASQKSGALVGDFNGDGSEDIALVVKPNDGKLEEINSDVANWILLDPHNVVLPDPNKAVQKLPAPARVKIVAGDTLLAVIHGYGKGGWRNPDARQAFLLKNVIVRDAKVESKQDAANDFKAPAPRVSGDIIRQDGDRAHGFLYWAGAKYVWFAATKSAEK
jgi:hypothetical protein